MSSLFTFAGFFDLENHLGDVLFLDLFAAKRLFLPLDLRVNTWDKCTPEWRGMEAMRFWKFATAHQLAA